MMPNNDLIRDLAAQAWQQALQEKSREFASDVARKLAAELSSHGLQPPLRSRELRDGASLISASKTQSDALEALMTAIAAIVPQCGLLILRGSQATGWASVGMGSPENFKRTNLDCSRGVVATVLNSCTSQIARAADLVDPAFVAQTGLDSAAEVLLVPMLVKERAAALLLAISGSEDDQAALELLIQIAQLSLDLQAYRKPGAAATVDSASAKQAVQAPAIFPPLQPTPEPPQARAAAAAATQRPAASSSAPVQPAAVQPPSDELHARSRRFAKLLVEEIDLYNHAKVVEGRANRDLYNRLREEIEKSRDAYQRRFGETIKDVDYFTQELMRILADNDPQLMGAGFPG